MKAPDASTCDSRPDRLRGLVQQAGLSTRAAAKLVGVSERAMRYYLTNPENGEHRPAQYPIVFCIEALAAAATAVAVRKAHAQR